MGKNKNLSKVAVLAISGGMDSTSLLLHLLVKKDIDQVYTVSFNYGQKHSIELERVIENIRYLGQHGIKVIHKELDISFLGKLFNSALTSDNIEVPEGHYAEDNMKATVVPNRNAIFSSIIYGYALSLATQGGPGNLQSAVICLGIHAGDHDIYPDCRQEFRDALGHAFAIGNWDSSLVEYYTPYIALDKAGILKDAEFSCTILDLNFWTIMKNTNTCYKPDEEGRSCGKCGSCQERLLAFTSLGLKDPVEYKGDYLELVRSAQKSEEDFKNGDGKAN